MKVILCCISHVVCRFSWEIWSHPAFHIIVCFVAFHLNIVTWKAYGRLPWQLGSRHFVGGITFCSGTITLSSRGHVYIYIYMCVNINYMYIYIYHVNSIESSPCLLAKQRMVVVRHHLNHSFCGGIDVFVWCRSGYCTSWSGTATPW